uniref:Uncharacterized protein n=1 Tax=Setaria viridis TaxID=4556 RepID=A0A4U6U7B9_SETVI|nr:hypothetical protein SEVIR_6G238532v2 [Setaria viridis]
MAAKFPPGKRDFLIPVDEKHDYDWLMTPPAESTFTWIVVRGGQGRSAPSPSTASKAYSFDTMHWHAPIRPHHQRPAAPPLSSTSSTRKVFDSIHKERIASERQGKFNDRAQ